jgi:hypothetical protein
LKYNILINQLVLSETKLDITDCAILIWIDAICKSVNEKVDRSRLDGWTLIDYGYLIKEMPLLKIKSRGALTPRIRRIEESGFAQFKHVGRQLYAKLTPKIETLGFVREDGKEAMIVHETERSRPQSFTKLNDIVHETEPIITLYSNPLIYGEFEKVKLTKDEYDKLVERLGQKNTDLLIGELDAYIASNPKGKKYTNHYAVLLTWARRKLEDHKKTKSNIAF